MGVCCTHDARLEQSVVLVHSHQCFYDKHDKTKVVFGSLAGTMEQNAGVCCETPVVVLTRTVDAIERFLVEEHTESVAASYLLHQ